MIRLQRGTLLPARVLAYLTCCDSRRRPFLPSALCGARNVKDQLESLVGFMVERGILLEEAVTEFEKKFIRRVLEKLNGNQSRAAKILGIHRNTLSRKIGAYKLDHVGRSATKFANASEIPRITSSQSPKIKMAGPWSEPAISIS